MPKHFLSLHTIFILNENIKWLEEFIIYYKHIGFDHFYLYDNEGSIGRNGSTSNYNKYGFKIKSYNKPGDIQTFNRILDKYGDMITYQKWQPTNLKNEIEYGQHDGVRHFIETYGKETEWVAFLDLDEFLFSINNINIPEYLSSLPNDISCLKITQKKFIDRFLSKRKYITQDYRCIDNLSVGTEWSPKNILRCMDFLDMVNIHDIHVIDRVIVLEPDIIRFNHYNVNDKQLSWIKQFYKHEYSLNGLDDGMKRYKHLFPD